MVRWKSRKTLAAAGSLVLGAAVATVLTMTTTASASPGGSRDHEGFYMFCTPIDRTPGYLLNTTDHEAPGPLTGREKIESYSGAAALGGSGAYQGRAMGGPHAGLRIPGDAFDRVARHLVAILREYGVDEDTVGQIADSLGLVRLQIVIA